MRNLLNHLFYLAAGIYLGVIFIKTEVISWFRIQEMFRFESFHMYGVIGSAVVLGIISIQLIKRFKVKDVDGNEIVIQPKAKNKWAPLLGGTIFGCGWAMTGACPGPIYILIGNGFMMFIV
ncbi:MAG: YeeE/YedE thiosulfate transporter family protein, partial [Leptospirales bacterium]